MLSATFSFAVRHGNRRGFWNTKAMSRHRSFGVAPSIVDYYLHLLPGVQVGAMDIRAVLRHTLAGP